MPTDKDFKKLVRRRMADTGERYTRARAQMHSEREPSDSLPGWFMAGTRPQDYECGLEEVEGRRAAFIRSVVRRAPEFGTVMQMILAEEYVGKRVRFSADVRSLDIRGWGGGLWMRIDGPSKGRAAHTLAFDNMHGRTILGSADWARVAVVLDVAPEAQAIGFGALLGGTGTLWFADVRFEIVGTEVPRTSLDQPRPSRPRNLDFSDAG